MLEVKSVTKKFGDNVAVSELSLSVAEPQIIGIIGRSGAGKSTFLRIMNRMTDATSGELLVDGTNVLSLKSRAKMDWQRNCAMIFQQFNLVPRLNVLTNVILGRLNQQSILRSSLSFFTQSERHEALHLMDRFGVAQTASQRAETLSGGQQQRVAICRAMMQQPKFILADEPIASLDPLNARLVMEALQKINQEEKITVICNLHTLDTARTYCDRVIGMREGQKVFDDVPAALTDAMAREIYGAEAEEAFEGSITSTSLSGAESAALLEPVAARTAAQ
ncbi:MAG TPA: phosphonate ABC transporter ATP-binding protein [Gammaproteobacteria bacterium]|nr:phosphonate ABC transporter ATP-binding protein [Gammaproteobacteria bacterium]